MKGYAVHLLCHLLAIICGAAAGIAGALWWFLDSAPGLWAAVAALVLGVLVLVMQWSVIRAAEPERPQRRGGTRPGMPQAVAHDGSTRSEIAPPSRWG